MNTYKEDQQQTVIDTLQILSNEQANLNSVKTTAEYSLYLAQGAEITARDKHQKTNGNITTWKNINDQSLINNNQSFNLLTSATNMNANVATSITNTATAASNVQIASNAISALASDIGAAFNIATASLYETDVYDKIKDANNFINEVANESKKISKHAMQATGLTSEITITEVLAQTTTLKSEVDNLYKSTDAKLNQFSQLGITECAQVNTSSIAERHSEGVLANASKEVIAITEAYTNTNNKLNQNLTVVVKSASEILVSFKALPLPTFYSPNATPDKICIPPAGLQYFLVLLPAQNQTMFSIDQAEQLFAQWGPSESQTPEEQKASCNKNKNKNVVRFYEISEDESGQVVVLSKDGKEDKDDKFIIDVYGNPVKPGDSYVAYLYIEPSKPYKQYISNYSDLLSAPTQAFIPATTLPFVNDWHFTQTGSDNDIKEWKAEFNVNEAGFQDPAVPAAKNAVKKAKTTVDADKKAVTKAEGKLIAANSLVTKEKIKVDAAEKAEKENPNAKTKAILQAAIAQLDKAKKAQTEAEANFNTAKKTLATSETELKTNEDKLNKLLEDSTDDPDLQFRCILVEVPRDPDLNLLTSQGLEFIDSTPPKNEEKSSLSSIYFNLAIAEQISPANYTVATMSSDTSTTMNHTHEFKFSDTTTDNFGNLINPAKTYKPYILTLDNRPNSTSFLNVLDTQKEPGPNASK